MGSSNRLSYSARLFLWLLAYSLLLVVCFITFQYHREKEFKANELNTRMQLINGVILRELSEGYDISVNNGIKGLLPLEGLRVSIIDYSGQVIYDNSLDSVPGTNHLNREEIHAAINDGSGYTLRRHSESTGDTYFYSATRGDDGTIVRTAIPYTHSLVEMLRADHGFLWVMGAITMAMCIIGYIATHRVGQHIIRLRKFARQAERGERIYDTAPFPHDELGDISNDIVRLYARLQQANSDRDREHRATLHEQQEKERIKKQLTNNINHELKTPVASIQVCLETLIDHPDMSEEKKQEFRSRCLANSERLKNLLADVSLITRMDDGGTAITKENLNLTDIIHEVVTECTPIADSKGIRINDSINTPIQLNGNQSLLSSVFRNLIDNAIAYSNGTRIDITLENTTPGRTTITLSDNGAGVEPEHLSRLFERFYRVDKGRSRAIGGTGLGLSIVKNAILMHNGTITVANRPTGGLRFTITLPTP